jgi:hypothetical protein
MDHLKQILPMSGKYGSISWPKKKKEYFSPL